MSKKFVAGKSNSNRDTADNELVGGVSGLSATTSTEAALIPQYGGINNSARGTNATVAGGAGNSAVGSHAAVAAGESNQASSDHATVSGGQNNSASAPKATVGGGQSNQANGNHATVPGGVGNVAGADDSLAAGSHANVQSAHHGAMLFSDDSGVSTLVNPPPFNSVAPNEFAVRCTGGSRFVTAIDSKGSPTSGVTLAAGGGSWSSLSDRNVKENFENVDGVKLLERLDRISVTEWNYKTQDSAVRHLGPTAQDFHAEFGLGEDNLHISMVDADGIAFASIQALYRMNLTLKQENRILKENIKQIRSRLTNLEKSVGPTRAC